jgi:hypothetical protein
MDLLNNKYRKKAIYIFFILFIQVSAQGLTKKTTSKNGKMSQGLVEPKSKNRLLNYYRTGKKEEGHYEANKKSKWWIFYKS